MNSQLAPGTRINVRGEDFLITNLIPNVDSSYLIDAEGISELVKGKKFKFDTAIDKDIQALDPSHTELKADIDSGYRKTKLFLETQVRLSTVYNKKINIAHKAAFNLADYQLAPTLKALKLPRPRILIADGVGLGKTIEVGILLAEMIKRGKGQRIMVLALKSILSQFQQEIWNRFAIPLVRLDSHGIARIKTELPANKNPFDYYDKTIVSIDTLKNNAKFRHYIEKSRWDIIVIDECHTVANISSQRGDLAQFLATRCESLVLTSATPHNGKRQSFANLIKMIEPIAIPQSGEFEKKDVEPFYVRRFKNHILDDSVRSNFQDRKVIPIHADLNPEEIAFLEYQQKLKFTAISGMKDDTENQSKFRQDFLFAIGIFKAYMSSPEAALATIRNRISRIEKKENEAAIESLEMLNNLRVMLEDILKKNKDAKFDAFEDELVKINWTGKEKDDRIVIFAERIDTIKYLKQRLKEKFNLDDKVLAEFHGGYSDTEQQAIIDDFGKQDSDVRILICSDAGSQGVNLHYFCHKMFNYDIPWSLITLEQRNGRIDRYGQKQTPYIYYMISKSELEGLKTDLHILENLVKKEEEVYKTFGDIGAVLKLYSSDEEEQKTEKAIEEQDENFLFDQEDWEMDADALFGGDSDVTHEEPEIEPILENAAFYENDESFYHDLITQLKSNGSLANDEAEFIDHHYLEVKNTSELHKLLFDLPAEAKPKVNDVYRLTTLKEDVQKSIEEARKKKGEWAKFQMLYDLHPVLKYFTTKLEADVDKDVALVAKISKLPANTAWYVLKGQIANNLGQAIISEFVVLPINLKAGGLFDKPMILSDFISAYSLNQQLYTENIEENYLEVLKKYLPDVIEFSKELHMQQIQQRMSMNMEALLNEYMANLARWQDDANQQLEIDFQDKNLTGFMIRKKENRLANIDSIVSKSSQYIKDLTSLSQDAYIKVLAVFYNNEV
jgi:SNF2 family DNA or RNA helicase